MMEDLKKIQEFFSKPEESVNEQADHVSPMVVKAYKEYIKAKKDSAADVDFAEDPEKAYRYYSKKLNNTYSTRADRDAIEAILKKKYGSALEEIMSIDDQAKAYFLEKFKKGEIDSLPDNPKAAFLDQMMKDEMEKDAAQFRSERGLEETNLSEAFVPSNIKEFAKRKGVSSLVNTVAGWAERVGKRITGGTAIGKNYDTLILDMRYQDSAIRINTENETIELYDEPVRSFQQFKKVYEEYQEEEESINELDTATYRSALQKGRSRGDSKGKGIATSALNLLAKKAAQTLAGQSFEVAGSLNNVTKGISKSDVYSYINQALMTFTGVGELYNPRDINIVGSDEVHFLMDVGFQLPDNIGGWSEPVKFKGYKNYKFPAKVQFSIKDGKVWVWFKAADTDLEFTRPGARAIAKLADMVAQELQLQTPIKHNSIKQFDAIKPTEKSVNEAQFTDYSNKELAAYAKELSKQRADAASKGQDSLVSSLNKDIEAATRELKKRSQKLKDLNRTDVKEGTWALGNAKDIQRILDVLIKLKDNAYNVIGDDIFFDGLDSAISRAEELMMNAPMNEGMGGQLDEKYFIEVSVRDARKALNIYDDMFGGAGIEMYGSNVYASNNFNDLYDLYMSFMSNNIEIIDSTNFDQEPDDEENLFEADMPYNKKISLIKSIIQKVKSQGEHSSLDDLAKNIASQIKIDSSGTGLGKGEFKVVKGKLEEEEGYSKYLVSPENPKGKTPGLTPDVMSKILMKIATMGDDDVEETTKLGEGVVFEELCEKGKAYIKKRQAAGEKSSAYLSGRAVKVCKGQMKG